MSKKIKIIDIKSAREFYKELRNLVANHFNGYDNVGLLDGMTEKQKKTVFEFGCGCISLIYNPIQKRYTKQERKKYDKQIAWYENKLVEKEKECEGHYNNFVDQLQKTFDLEKQLAENDKEKEELRNSFIKLKEELNKQYDRCDRARKKAINQLSEKDKEIKELKQTINIINQNISSASVDDVNFIHELENQLAEKDKEIESLRLTIDEMSNANKNIHKAFEVFDKNLRHQICEKIRYYLFNHVWCNKDCRYVADIDKKLDQIEKGEKADDN